MTKRSDFAQKLLDDLRVRKEQMAVTQISGRANTTSIDVYSFSKQRHKESSGNYIYKTTGSKTGGQTHKRPHPRDKSLAIVDTRRGRSSHHIGDLSMAVTLAQQNGGKLGGMDFSNSPNIISFLHQIGSGSMDFGKKAETKSSYVDKRSHFHVNEISKGALKLNQILRACANNNHSSITFDKGSIEIGKKLLKGAMDLEESLRMLVNQQEASGFKIKPQSKNRIRLLGDEELEEEEEDDNILAVVDYHKPKFSFDRPSRHSRGGSKGSGTDINQSRAVLTYAKVQTSNLSGSNQEKKGVRNVIAKLMGLHEFPENHEANYLAPHSPKELNSLQNILRVVSEKHDPQNVGIQMVNQKMIQSNKIIEPRNNTFVLQTDNNLLSTRSNTVVHDGKQLLAKPDNVEHEPQTTRSRNAAIKTNKETKSFTQRNDNESTGRSETKAPEAASSPLTKINQTENHHKRHNGTGLRHKNNIKTLQSSGEKHVAEVKEHRTVKQKSQVAAQIKNESYMKSTTKTIHDIIDLHKRAPQMNQFTPGKRSHIEAIAAISNNLSPRMKQHENLVNGEASTSSSVKLKDLVTSFIDTRSRKPPATQKIEEAYKKPRNSPRHIKSRISVLQEEVKVKKDKSIIGPKIAEIASPSRPNEAETSIVLTNTRTQEIAERASTSRSNRKQEAPLCHSHVEDECEGLKDPHAQATNGSITSSGVPNGGEGEVRISGPDQELKPRARVSTLINVTQKRSLDRSYSLIMELHKSRNEEPLTDDEKHLKQILILNQLFLNAAEAFFKLNIPVGILHTSGSSKNVQDEQNKLILECGYEILERKGRRQELTNHPFATTSIVRSLNNLIKQIQKDFEKLKSYVISGSSECDVEEYLAKMIGKDLYAEDADRNSMWDFGWSGGVSSFMEKDEVIRDIDKDLIDGLIHEILVDFLHVRVSG